MVDNREARQTAAKIAAFNATGVLTIAASAP